MKKALSTIIALLILGCNSPENKSVTDSVKTNASSSKPAINPDQLITPGTSIGHLAIGLPVDSAIVRLGRPDYSDAAMGHSLMKWYSKDAGKHRTAVFAGRDMGNEDVSRIKRIMVSSPWFKTREGIATGSAFADIEKFYKLKKMDDFTAQQKGLQVYDSDKGITFDMDSTSKKCVAITVHKAHENPGTYINMHE